MAKTTCFTGCWCCSCFYQGERDADFGICSMAAPDDPEDEFGWANAIRRAYEKVCPDFDYDSSFDECYYVVDW